MRDEFNFQNDLYADYAQVISKVNNFFLNQKLHFLQYSNQQTADRLTNLVVISSFKDFCASYGHNQSRIENSKLSIDSNGVVKTKLGAKLLLDVIKYWAYLNWVLLKKIITPVNSEIISILDINDHEKQITDALKEKQGYLKTGPIKFFQNDEKLLVTNTHVSNPQDKDILTCEKMPLFFAFSNLCKLSLVEILLFSLRFNGSFFSYLLLCFKEKFCFYLYKDFCLHFLLEELNRKDLLKSYFVTCSNLEFQILPLTHLQNKRFSYHVIWYSTNSKAFQFKAMGEKTLWESPYLWYHRYDVSWVWNNDQIAWLRDSVHFQGKIEVVGPIMFKSIKPDHEKYPDKFVAIFDVTPFYESYLKQTGYLGYYYYKSANAIKFLEDILESLKDCPWPILLKTKRAYGINHDQAYIDYLKRLEMNKKIVVVDYNSDPFALINQAQVVFTMPFSSTMYIAEHLNTASVIYDPTGELVSRYKTEKESFYVQNKQILKQTVSNLVNR